MGWKSIVHPASQLFSGQKRGANIDLKITYRSWTNPQQIYLQKLEDFSPFINISSVTMKNTGTKNKPCYFMFKPICFSASFGRIRLLPKVTK